MIDVRKYEAIIKDFASDRFEGESPATAYFYEKQMRGMGKLTGRCDRPVFVFRVNDEEREAFGWEDTVQAFAFMEDSLGFAWGWPETRTVERIMEDYAKELALGREADAVRFREGRRIAGSAPR